MNDRTLVALPIGMAAYLATYLILTLAIAALAGGRAVLRPLLWLVLLVAGVAGGAATALRAGAETPRRQIFSVALGATAGVTALLALATYIAGETDVGAPAGAVGGIVIAGCGALVGVILVRRSST